MNTYTLLLAAAAGSTRATCGDGARKHGRSRDVTHEHALGAAHIIIFFAWSSADTNRLRGSWARPRQARPAHFAWECSPSEWRAHTRNTQHIFFNRSPLAPWRANGINHLRARACACERVCPRDEEVKVMERRNGEHSRERSGASARWWPHESIEWRTQVYTHECFCCCCCCCRCQVYCGGSGDDGWGFFLVGVGQHIE